MITREPIIPPLQTVHSDQVVFQLLRDFLFGIQSKNIDEILSVFHVDAKFKDEIEAKQILYPDFADYFSKECEKFISFWPSILIVTFDKKLSKATGVFEYEFEQTNLDTGIILQMCLFTVKDNLIISYDGGLKKKLRRS